MTDYLSATDLADMRAAQNALLPDTCTITLPGTTRTADGGVIETETTVASGVACRLRVVTPGEEALRGDAALSVPRYILTLASTVTLTEKHRVTVGGIRYNVLNVNRGSWRTATRAELEPLKARPL